MSDRAQRPLNQDAVKAADAALYQKHAGDPRPNALYDADGNQKPLDPNDPSQAGLRQEWLDSYKANGGQMEPSDESGGTPDQPVLPCGQQAQVDPLIIGEPTDLDESDDGFDDTPDPVPDDEPDDEPDDADSTPEEDGGDSPPPGDPPDPGDGAGGGDPPPLAGTGGLPSKASRIVATPSQDPGDASPPPDPEGGADADENADPS